MSGYDIFTNIEQVGTRGVCLYVSHNWHASPLELEASHLFSESAWAIINLDHGDTLQINLTICCNPVCLLVLVDLSASRNSA